MKLIYLVVLIIIVIIAINLYLFIQNRKNKGKDNYLETKELHDLSRDVHSVDYEISRAQAHMTYHNSGKMWICSLTYHIWKGYMQMYPFHMQKNEV